MLNPQQIQEMRAKAGIPPEGLVNTQQKAQTAEERIRELRSSQPFNVRIGMDIKDRGQNISNNFDNSGSNFYDPLLTGLKNTAQGFNAISDVAGETVRSIPGGNETLDTIQHGLGAGMGKVVDTLSDLPAYQQYAEANPNKTGFEKGLEGLQASGEISGNILLADQAAKGLQGAVNTIKKVPKVFDAIEDKVIDYATKKRADQFSRAFNQAKSTRANEVKYGQDSSKFATQLEKEGVDLPLNKDVRGKADWSEARANVEQIAQRDNAALRELLKSNNTYTDLDEAANAAKEAAKLKYHGTSQANALQHIDDELNAYKSQYGSIGVEGPEGHLRIPTDVINDIKSDLWSKGKFNQLAPLVDQTKAGTSRLFGYAIKDAVEKAVGGDGLVSELNQRLGNIQSLLNTLSKADGGNVYGGFIGKLSSRVLGAAIGSSQGPVGAVTGAITGDMIADAFSNPNLSLARYILARAKTEVPEILQRVEQQIGKNADQILKRAALPAPSYVESNLGHSPGINYNLGEPSKFEGTTYEAQTPRLSSQNSNTTANTINNTIDSNPITDGVNSQVPMEGSIEAMSEAAGGWQPGLKKIFDTALAHKDVAKITELLPQIPAEYANRFAQDIAKILNK